MVAPHSTCSPCDVETLERIVRLDVDPRARVASIVQLPTSSRNAVVRVDLEGGEGVVVKLREGEGQRIFEKEAHQLAYLAGRPRVPVPRLIAHRKDGAAGPLTYIVLGLVPGIPWSTLRSISLKEDRDALQRRLGDLLGRLHAEVTAPRFGEVLPGSGPTFASWSDLFASLWEARLEAVVKSERLDAQTLDAVDWIHRNLPLLVDVRDSPRLVHGNLTATKILCVQKEGGWDVGGLLDPALCYGHHEMDLALLELSGAVDEAFFESYSGHLPIQDGYALRKHVYMLYYVLEKVRLYGNTHHILTAMDCSREILQRYGC